MGFSSGGRGGACLGGQLLTGRARLGDGEQVHDVARQRAAQHPQLTQARLLRVRVDRVQLLLHTDPIRFDYSHFSIFCTQSCILLVNYVIVPVLINAIITVITL